MVLIIITSNALVNIIIFYEIILYQALTNFGAIQVRLEQDFRSTIPKSEAIIHVIKYNARCTTHFYRDVLELKTYHRVETYSV